MIFFQHPRVKLASFFEAICDNLALESSGTKALKLNICEEILGFKGLFWPLKANKKPLLKSIILLIVLQNQK